MPPSVLKNFHRETLAWKWHAEPNNENETAVWIWLQKKLRLSSPELKPSDYHVLENILGQSHVPSENRIYRQTQGNSASDSLTQHTIDRAAKVFKTTEYLCLAQGGHFYYSQ